MFCEYSQNSYSTAPIELVADAVHVTVCPGMIGYGSDDVSPLNTVAPDEGSDAGSSTSSEYGVTEPSDRVARTAKNKSMLGSTPVIGHNSELPTSTVFV